MSRPHNNHNHNNHRGRGNGRGRGRPPGGPGIPSGGRASIAPPRPSYPHANTEIDVVIQQWPEPGASPVVTNVDVSGNVRGNGNLNRRSGPWRGGTPKSRSGAGTPRRGFGFDSPRRGDSTPRGVGPSQGRGRGGGRGRGRGRGRGGGWVLEDSRDLLTPSHHSHVGVGGTARARARAKIVGKDAPLSDLLYAERPLLRPIKFVRATLTPFLFLHSEEMLRSVSDVVADTTATSGVPTADRVAQVFRENKPESSHSEPEHCFQDALEEVDFADLAQICAQVDAIASGTVATHQDAHEDIQEVDFADLATIRAQVDAAKPRAASRDDVVEETFTGVYSNIKGTTQVSSGVDDVQQRKSISTSRIPDESSALEPSINISHQSRHESTTLDTFVVEGEAPRTSGVPVTDTHTASIPSVDLSPPTDVLEPGDGPHPLFVFDTTPSLLLPPRSASDVILVDRTGHGDTLGDQDDELIVYVAPHPRSGRASPVPAVPHVKLPHTSVLTGKPIAPVGPSGPGPGFELGPVREDDEERAPTTVNDVDGEEGDHATLSLAALSLAPDPADRLRPTRTGWRARKREAGIQRKRQRQSKRSRMGFGAFGAMVSEAQLRETDGKTRRRMRWETRRRDDSDLDWGTEDESEENDKGEDKGEDEDEVDALSNGLGGMEIDPDLDLDVDAMDGFLKSMSAEGSRFVTMDDIGDEVRIQQEDEDRAGSEGSSDSQDGSSNDEEEDETSEEEEEEVFDIEEQILIAESEDDGALSLDSDDDDLSPRSRFRSRLHKVRERGRHQRPKTIQDEDEEEEDEPEIMPWTRGADDEAFLTRIEDILEENTQILSGRDRKLKKALFQQLHQGHDVLADERDMVDAFLDDPEFSTPVKEKKKQAKKGKGKQGAFAAELEAQWAKDRAKKTARKRARAEARLLAALDPLGTQNGNGKGEGNKKGGGKGKETERRERGASRKAMRAAARLLDSNPDAAHAIAPHAAVDLVSLEAQIRRFVADVRDGRRKQMSLPPMDKGMRKLVHEMANAFGVKSKSAGREGARYTTLIGTNYTGVSVKEGRVRLAMKRFGGAKGGREKGGQSTMPRHREGDEVGKAAPKIGESNVGFKMLASMGWSEGDRIGGTGSVGIEAPLTAIIKHSKLGLGATR